MADLSEVSSLAHRDQQSFVRRERLMVPDLSLAVGIDLARERCRPFLGCVVTFDEREDLRDREDPPVMLGSIALS
jgi:hypothetical protein